MRRRTMRALFEKESPSLIQKIRMERQKKESEELSPLLSPRRNEIFENKFYYLFN